MEQYAFLSPEWIEAARQLRAEAAGSEPTPTVEIRMNLVIADVPDRTEPIEAHLDTTQGQIDLELGLLDSADVRVRLDYDTARAILVDGNGEAAMQAFLAGRVQVEGDMTRLLQFQSMPVNPNGGVAAQIRAITA
jgi:hypothetical protein